MVQIIDRRNKALGGQNNTRNKKDITGIAWHYTATTNSSIENHERYWKNSRGWTYGGYHFYIDRDGNIYQNYNLETVSNGVAGHNSRIVNVCCEASRADNYTQAQIDARHELTVWLMDELNLKASDVKQHGEFSGANTSCAGYSKAQMNEFRARLAGGKPVQPASKPKEPVNNPKVEYTGSSIVDYLNHNKIDSSIGNRKKLAQKHLGISNYTGTAKQNTDLLNAMRKGKPKPAAQAWTGQVLRQGNRGDAVRQLQNMLAKKYFYPDKGAKNNGIDGIYGAKTKNAVERFQTMNGLKVDGIAGRATYNKLR